MIKLRRIKNVSLGQCVRPLLSGKITLGAFSRNDLAPFLMELNFLIKNLREIIRIAGSSSG
jgi:hypothetical protein